MRLFKIPHGNGNFINDNGNRYIGIYYLYNFYWYYDINGEPVRKGVDKYYL